MTMLKNDDEARLDAPRNDLIRGLMPLRAEEDGNTMVGYPIVFNQWTEINSWEGRFLERVLPSGPVKSMKEGRQKVQYNHGMHPVVGSSGLGKPRVMKRDSFGVYAEVPLSDTSYNRDIIRPLLADGVLNGMSFRFSVVEDRWKKPDEPADHNPEMLPERSLVEFKWPEFGPVDWPAYEATQAGIRSQAALALWLQTPHQQRSELLRQFAITAPAEPTIWAPGWEPRSATGAPKTVIPDAEERSEEDHDQQDDPAGDDATEDEQEEDGPDEQATRSEDTYQPAQRTPMSRERRQAQMGTVRAFLAQTSKE
jgi:HK97 family phage prohead protease